MDRQTVDWQGYIPAITTPFDQDGAFNKEMHSTLLEWLLAEGMHGIVIAGTTGEWFTFRPQDRLDLFRNTSDVLKGKMVLVGGCSGYTADEVAINEGIAADCGFSGILVTPPPYAVPTEEEIFSFYQEVNNRITLPMCIYNWPPGTNIDMSLPLLERLAGLDKVVAIKNSTGDFGRFLNCFFALKDSVRIYGIPMNEIGASLVMHHNADGLMGAGAVLGRDQPNFFNALWDGNLDEAIRLGAMDRKIMTDWFNPDYTAKFGSAPAVFKEALNVQGLPGGYPRKPILPIAPKHREVICATLEGLGKTLVHDTN